MTDASTETKDAPKTETVDLKGRSVVIRELNDAQIALMAREARLLSKDGIDGQRKLDAVARMFNILESVVIDSADKSYMDDLIAEGELDLRDLTGFVSVFSNNKDEAPVKVRRGRPAVKRS